MSGNADRLSTALADRYRIVDHLGEGGMATVYLAEDVKHDRKVAVKVLRPELAAVIGAERFVQEIKTTAALQHPHILPLFDSGEADSFLFYVMPFIDGETLRDKLNRETQLGIEESVRIARDVADALDYAHRQDIIHRDIKPENILLHDGRPMVADFGIALAVSAAAGGRMTETGLSLGTPHYMSPEQATADKDLTNRSDIYSLGSMLYEMLTGDPPHTGSSAQQIIMKIVTDDPAPITRLRKSVPPNVAAAIAQAIQKVPADRFGTAAEFADALANPHFESTVVTTGSHGKKRLSRPASLPLVGLIATGVAVLAFGLGWMANAGDPPRGVGRQFRLETPGQNRIPVQVALSADGERLAILLVDSTLGFPDGTAIWSRAWTEREFSQVTGTNGSVAMAFAPTGSQLAFMVDNDLKSVDLSGTETPVTLSEGVDFSSLSWGEDGFIYGAYNRTGLPRVWRVPEAGGTADSFTTRMPGHTHRNPAALPESAGLLFTIIPNGFSADGTLGYLNAATDSVTELADGIFAQFVDGVLVWLSNAYQLMVAPFDPRTSTLSEAGAPFFENVLDFTVSPQGDLLFTEGSGFDPNTGVRLYSVNGEMEIVEWPFDIPNTPHDPIFSPDQTKLAVIHEIDSFRIFVKDIEGGPVTTLNTATNPGRVTWSGDGQYIGYETLDRENGHRFWRQRADGSGGIELLWTASERVDVGRWSLDQPMVVATAGGLAVLTQGADTLTHLFNDGGEYSNPTLSPDGNWIAYTDDNQDRVRVVVRPYPNAQDGLFPISVGPRASDPTWSADGSTLYYSVRHDNGRYLAAARVRTTPAFTVARRDSIMELQTGYGWQTGGWLYDVAPRGDRVVIAGHWPQPPVVTGIVFVEGFLQTAKARLGR